MDGSAAPIGDVSVGDDELHRLAILCNGGASRKSENGRDYILLEGLRFKVQGAARVSDALLCLNYPNSGYPTKLFLPEKIGCGLNWNSTEYILARHWETWSWRDVSPDLPLLDVLALHLAAFQ